MELQIFLSLLGVILSTFLVMTVVFLLKGRFVKSEPNEWMIVLKDGKPLSMGIGISGFYGWYDTFVKFPSQIYKVSFSMQQVTSENQGIEVSGVLLWSIYRENNGPFLAYQKLGEDLQTGVPTKANGDLRDSTYAILRQSIANSTILDVIKNRHTIRNSMKKELNELVNQWGVWIENVEITNVTILSNTLFKNLQTKFREEKRREAEMISMEIEKELNTIKTKNKLQFEEWKENNKTKISVAQTEKGMILENENQIVYENELKIQAEKEEVKKNSNIQKKEYEFAYYTQKNKTDAEIKKIRHEQDLVFLTKEHEVNMYKTESNKLTTEQQNKIDVQQAEFNRQVETTHQQTMGKAYTGKFLKMKAMDVVSEVYRQLPAQEIKMINFNKATSDPIIGNLAQAVQSLDVIKSVVQPDN